VWPFQVQIAGDVSGGQPAHLLVRTDPGDKSRPARVNLAVDSFVELAAHGGLGGNALLPLESHAQVLRYEPPSMDGDPSVWEFSSLAVDPRSLGVLLNVLEAVAAEVQFVELRSRGHQRALVPKMNDYPPMTPAVPFRLDSRLIDRNVTVEVVFRRPLEDTVHTQLVKAVESWTTVGLLGGFRIGELPPLESVVPPMTQPTLVLDAFTFSLEKVTAHDTAYSSLVNVLVRFGEIIAPIEEVNIS
jgi:hypothetical protein